MKFRFLLTLLFIAFNLSSIAQSGQQTCHFGINFEISESPSWGYGEPIVRSVQPHSPADLAGIKAGDIIMEINGQATYLRNTETIASWLYYESDQPAKFTIRNLDTYFKEYVLARLCTDVYSISESDLSTAFSFYSLEDVSERSFVLPLTTTTNSEVDYSDYHTYDFLIDKDAPRVDAIIMKYLEKALADRGLKRDTKDPDFIVQTYYSFLPNPKYNGMGRPNSGMKSWRYDSDQEKLMSLPIIAGDDFSAATRGEYLLEMGLRFLDKKYIESKTLVQIWDCSAKEYLTAQYDLAEYARVHLPLMLMQFPYPSSRSSANYIVSSKKYNYTGMYFDSRDMKTVLDVDHDSPAYRAGIRPGFVVKKINEWSFNSTRDELMNGYKRFMTETMVYRNPATKFVDAKGYPDCMFWSHGDYKEVEKVLKKDIYAPSFAYLFAFVKYVSSKYDNVLNIEGSFNGGKREYKVVPEVRSSVSVYCK